MKQAQITTWVMVLALIFFVIVAWYISIKPFTQLDDAVSGEITGARGNEILDHVYKFQKFWPLALVVGLLLLALFYSLKRDPNQYYY